MDSKAEKRAAILKTVEQELDVFLDKEEKIKDSSEYEEALMSLAMGIARGVLKGSAGPVSTDRNKKKDSDLLRSDRG